MIRRHLFHAAVWFTAAGAALAQYRAQPPATADGPTNVLLVIGDDVGCDLVGACNVSASHGPTPVLDNLAAQGVLFTRAYANPICSPTRATILTGRYGFRTQIGDLLHWNVNEPGLALAETTIPEVLATSANVPIATSAIGKWHLGTAQTGSALNPNLQGFQYFDGVMGNLNFDTYFSYTETINGTQSTNTHYLTSEQADDAIARMAAMPEPWFCYLAFTAPHVPLHAPPQALHTYTLSGPPDLTQADHCRAAVQAMDTELGRVLASIDPGVLSRTTIVFLGDNGTTPGAVLPPMDPTKSKGTLFENGVHVPLIVAGRHVASPGRVCDALVNTVDLFPSVIELFNKHTEVEVPSSAAIDGVSIVPYLRNPSQGALRKWVYSERFSPNGEVPRTTWGRMLRDVRWKLIERMDGPDQFFDVGNDFQEGANLLQGTLTAEQSAAYGDLKRRMHDLTSN